MATKTKLTNIYPKSTGLNSLPTSALTHSFAVKLSGDSEFLGFSVQAANATDAQNYAIAEYYRMYGVLPASVDQSTQTK